MTHSVKLGSVSLDCADPVGLARFYARLLGVDVAFESEGFAAIRLGDLWLSSQRVDGYVPPRWPDPSAPQQLHLDLRVEDLDTGEEHAVGVGAVKAKTQPKPESWRVFIDPAGHPFCLTTLIPD
jgi:hypothetical protein